MSRTHQFWEDALMHRLGTLILVLTLALAPFALPAQSPTDLADVCKVLGDAKPGQWASFDGTGSSGVGKLRLAVVGSERAGDSTLYWRGELRRQGSRQERRRADPHRQS